MLPKVSVNFMKRVSITHGVRNDCGAGMNISNECSWCQYLTCAPSRFWKCSGSRHLGCNPSAVGGGLRVTCASGQAFDYSTVNYANSITPEIERLCVKACV